MPVQFPQVQDRVGDFTLAGYQGLAGGISSGVKSLAEGLERRREESKRLNQAGKASKAFLKAIGEQGGIDPIEVDSMSAADAIARMTALNAAQHYQAGALDAKKALALLNAQETQAANQARQPAFFAEAAQLATPQPPSNEALEAFYEGPGSMMSEESQRPQPAPMMSGLPLIATAAERSGYRLPDTALDDVLRTVTQRERGAGMDILTAFKAAQSPPPGFATGTVQVNPNGYAGVTFGPAPRSSTEATPIMVEGKPSGKARTKEGEVIDLSPPGAEGKTLTQSETQMLAAFNQAEQDLGTLEKIFKKLGPDWGGPISGRVKSAASLQNVNIAEIENAITGATPNLARGVFREVGVLTDEDIKRYKALLPTAYDTEAVRKVKMGQLRERIKQGRTETMQMLRQAGRDLSGFKAGAAGGESDDEEVSRRIQGVRSAIESTNAPAATPADKTALALELRAQHRDWSKARIIEEVNRLLP